MSFKPKRTPPAELARLVEAEAGSSLPTTTPPPTQQPPVPAAAPKADPTVQINFRGSRGLAKLIAGLAEKEGSTRKLIARLLRDAGHAVPETDLNPPVSRRRFD